MARNNYTSVMEWLSLPLRELGKWIEANNAVEAEARQRREEARGRYGR